MVERVLYAQSVHDQAGIDTRTIWTGNATRQPMMQGVAYRTPPGGLPHADRVMETGMLLSCSHEMVESQRQYVESQIEAFLSR